MEQQLVPFCASPLPAAQHILVLAPHPDDEVFGCGGALALHALTQAKITVVLITAGDQGGDEDIRQTESAAAADCLGYTPPICWHYPDRKVVYGESLIEQIVNQLTQGIDLVYAPSLWENHPDHRAVALAAIEACRRVPTTLFAYEIGAPLRPNHLLDISSVLAKKQQAMQCFDSQLRLQAYDRHINALNVFRTYTLPNNIQAAEAFERYTAEELAHYQLNFFTSEYQRQATRQLWPPLPQHPKISVLIRSMSRATLDDALNSLANQTYPNLEVIVVNACINQHTPLPTHCGPFPLRLIENNTGQPQHRSRAANLALHHAQGEFALFLDDDDWLAADHLSRLATVLLQQPAYGMAYTGATLVNSEKEIIGHFSHHPLIHKFLKFENFIPIHSALFRTTLSRNCQFDERLDIYEDWDFWLQLARNTSFYYLPGESAYYRIIQNDEHPVHQREVQEIALRQIFKKWQPQWEFDDFNQLREHIKIINRALYEHTTAQQQAQATIIELKAQLDDAKQQHTATAQALQHQLTTIYHSRSWRYTHALRSIGQKIRALWSSHE